ncbi:hypothetical protein ET33_30885 [Paenibacillus tyrfis]|uniref:Uncharacterized protein n=1 Tax=Paenibacillus tyrfis TaxID=1501230 RepID=A0A081NTP3_9BACL|nr:hypothetical protein ET33_30885 [Paenibacillus tyrfis]
MRCRSLRRDAKLERAEQKYNKLAVCELGGFQEKGFDDVKMVSPFENNKTKATNLLSKEFL